MQQLSVLVVFNILQFSNYLKLRYLSKIFVKKMIRNRTLRIQKSIWFFKKILIIINIQFTALLNQFSILEPLEFTLRFVIIFSLRNHSQKKPHFNCISKLFHNHLRTFWCCYRPPAGWRWACPIVLTTLLNPASYSTTLFAPTAASLKA